MNVSCTGCPAKYAVPDEKVRGKKVRITCKHCGTNIIVDGNALGAEAGERAKPVVQPATASLYEPLSAKAIQSGIASSHPAGVAEVSFLVGFSDDRQESRTLTQIVDMYRTGQLGDDDLVWKDGMANWLSPFDVPQIATAMLKRGVARRATTTEPHPDDEATLIVRSPLEDHELGLALAQAQAETRSAPPPASPKPTVLATPPAAAARRTEKRAAAVDLFGSVAAAGSEDDSSLDFRAADEPAHKLTGARNESSVLFSLAALTKGDAKTSPTQKARDREREKQASAAWFGESAPDSLLNMGGGGLSALAAPDFTKPVPEIVEPIGPSDPEIAPSPERPKKRGGALLWVALLAVGAVAGAVFVMKRSQFLAENAAAAPPTVTLVAAPTAPSASAPPTTIPTTEAQASAAAPSASQVAKLEATASAPSPGDSKPVPVSAPNAAAHLPTTTSSKLAEPVATNKPAESLPSTSKPAEPAGATEVSAFDKGAAVAALGAAAANAGSCKNPDGPTGTGKVSVTFAPSGRATATNVVGALAGTEVGGCVARLFRAARVPAFAGDPVTVSKSFSIE